MIIDFHTHIFPRVIIDNRSHYFNDPAFSLLYENPTSKMIDHLELLEAMDKYGIDRSIVMGFPWQSEEHCRLQNSYFSTLNTATHGRIVPFAALPSSADSDITSLMDDIKKQGFHGVGEVAFYHGGLDHAGAGYLDSILHHASRHHLILCLHVNEPLGHQYHGKYDTPFSLLLNILTNHPGADVVLAHWGGGLLFYELMPEVKKIMARVRYDTAASPYLYDDQIYTIAEKIAGSGKILFGSDYPLVSPERYLRAISGKIPDQRQRDDILSGNSLRLLER